MKIGHVIRAERVRQDMKQIVLAKGICTPSYLSKIERNLIDPSEEVVELLMKRLGMDVGKFKHPVQSNSEQEFSKLLKDSYRKVIVKRDKAYTKEQLDLLMDLNPVYYDQSNYYLYLLITFRFRLILGGDLEERYKELDVIHEFKSNLDSFQTYLYKLNKALLYYSTGKLRDAILNFEEVVDIAESIHLEEWEKAELHYMLGVAYTADIRIFNSIVHIRKALTYFREQFSMKRVLDCYILLGITYKKNEQYEEAFESYTKAKQICEEFDMQKEMGLIYHNLGSLNSILRNREEAVRYYKKSLKVKDEDTDNPFITIYCLVIEYSKSNDAECVLEWIAKGLALYEELKDKRYKSYYHHFKFYQSLYRDNHSDLSSVNETIRHFKDIEDYRYVQKYCTAIAEWYYANRKYKLSSVYFKEANRYGYIYKKIENWEDL